MLSCKMVLPCLTEGKPLGGSLCNLPGSWHPLFGRHEDHAASVWLLISGGGPNAPSRSHYCEEFRRQRQSLSFCQGHRHCERRRQDVLLGWHLSPQLQHQAGGVAVNEHLVSRLQMHGHTAHPWWGSHRSLLPHCASDDVSAYRGSRRS